MKSQFCRISTARKVLFGAAVVGGLGMATSSVQAESVTVEVENLAPDQGVFLTPLWVGFQDGSFDTINQGEDASSQIDSRAVETLAETGGSDPLSDEFMASGAGTVNGRLGATDGASPPRIGPGNTAQATFDLDGEADSSRYLSYGSMIIPSNDAFVANDDPQAVEVFDEDGDFVGGTFTIFGSEVLDAGVEVNDELRENVAFFEQAVGDIEAGVDEDGVVRRHPGFHGSQALPEATPQNILGGTARPGVLIGEVDGDFTRAPYPLARISITSAQAVPTPSAAAAGLVLLSGLALRRRRKLHA